MPFLLLGIVSSTFHFAWFVQSIFLGVAHWYEPIHPTFLQGHELGSCMRSEGCYFSPALCLYGLKFLGYSDTLFKASVASTLAEFNSIWDCATWIWDSPCHPIGFWLNLTHNMQGFCPSLFLDPTYKTNCLKSQFLTRLFQSTVSITNGLIGLSDDEGIHGNVKMRPCWTHPLPGGIWNGFLGTFGECSTDCTNCESVPSGLWFGCLTFFSWLGFLSFGVDIDSELIGSDGVPTLTWSALVWTVLSDLDLSSFSELSLSTLASNSNILPQLRDLCHDFTNDVLFTIFKELLNLARCSCRLFPTKLDVTGMKKPTILVNHLTIVVNDCSMALPLGHPAQIAWSFPNVPIPWRVITTKLMSWPKPGMLLLQPSMKLFSFLLELSMWLTTEITRLLPSWSFNFISN